MSILKEHQQRLPVEIPTFSLTEKLKLTVGENLLNIPILNRMGLYLVEPIMANKREQIASAYASTIIAKTRTVFLDCRGEHAPF